MWTGDIYSTNHNVFVVELEDFLYLKYKVGYEGNHGDYFLNSNVCMYIVLSGYFPFRTSYVNRHGNVGQILLDIISDKLPLPTAQILESRDEGEIQEGDNIEIEIDFAVDQRQHGDSDHHHLLKKKMKN